MPTLSNLIKNSVLVPGDVDWLHLLVGDWQVISDLAFADLVLWLPREDGTFVAVAHCRPSTGATVHYDDVVGRQASEAQTEEFAETMRRGVIVRSVEPRWYGVHAVREEIIPVSRAERTLGVIARQSNLGASRTPSRLELNYVEIADELVQMVSRGEFPSPNAPTGPRRGAPRVGDGLVRLDGEGEVLYASPNAMSCFHRFGVVGELVGRSLAEVITGLVQEHATVDETLPVVVMGRAPWRTDVESNGVCLSLRAVPLTDRGVRTGALLLCRDVSELRRRERELMTKDATIREIHHRVKNNLQTVAALLRLQARRTTPEAKAALEEAMRRVDTIATVHEMLSQTIDETVDFDEVFGRSLRLAADVAAADAAVRTVREGAFGSVRAEDATALALVLTELVANAVEHGLAPKGGGTVWIVAQRMGQHLRVTVADDGMGLPADGARSLTGLGTQIVTTLVHGELRGTITWRPRAEGGTEAVVDVNLREVRG